MKKFRIVINGRVFAEQWSYLACVLWVVRDYERHGAWASISIEEEDEV